MILRLMSYETKFTVTQRIDLSTVIDFNALRQEVRAKSDRV